MARPGTYRIADQSADRSALRRHARRRSAARERMPSAEVASTMAARLRERFAATGIVQADGERSGNGEISWPGMIASSVKGNTLKTGDGAIKSPALVFSPTKPRYPAIRGPKRPSVQNLPSAARHRRRTHHSRVPLHLRNAVRD